MTQYINNFSQKCGFTKTFSLLLLFLICLIVTSGIACGQPHQLQFEQTVTLRATDLLGADLMKSSLYKGLCPRLPTTQKTYSLPTYQNQRRLILVYECLDKKP